CPQHCAPGPAHPTRPELIGQRSRLDTQRLGRCTMVTAVDTQSPAKPNPSSTAVSGSGTGVARNPCSGGPLAGVEGPTILPRILVPSAVGINTHRFSPF